MEPATMIAAASALASLLGTVFGGKDEEVKQYPTLSPNQTAMQDELLKRVMEGFKTGPTRSFDYAPIRQQAENQFFKRTIPSIAEKFAGADAMRGGDFTRALGTASGDFQSNLAANEASTMANYDLQNNQNFMGNLMQMLQFGLQPRFSTGVTPAGQNAFGSAMSGAVNPFLSKLGGMYSQDQEKTDFLDALKSLGGNKGGNNSSNYGSNSGQDDIFSWLKNLNPSNMNTWGSNNMYRGNPLMNNQNNR